MLNLFISLQHKPDRLIRTNGTHAEAKPTDKKNLSPKTNPDHENVAMFHELNTTETYKPEAPSETQGSQIP